tara:strand:- start:4632 stop:5819 length:1188 start_codon:yes stop_codon:yes gene_type:complete
MNLTYVDLISSRLTEHARKVKNSNSEIISYYLNNTNGMSTIDLYQGDSIQRNYYTINNISHTLESKKFIRSIFDQLDPLIDLDFQEMNHSNGSFIDIYSVDYSSSFIAAKPDQVVLGQVIPQTSQTGSWWDILWKKTNNSIDLVSTDKNTIIHEIGHTLGLSHPKEDPFNQAWDTDDTVMSYNKSVSGWDYWFSDSDILALQSIWGRENDNKIMTFKGESNDYKFLRFEDNTFGIKSEIGKENIDDMEKLIFDDKSFNVQDDIKETFNQLTGIDDVTGRIFRLYNSALGRFPDADGLKYWIEKNLTGENTYRQTCESFIISEEFKNKYGKSTSNSTYLTTLYSNVLGRSPDQIGFNYWLNQLNNNIENRGEVLMGFSESVENKALFLATTGLTYE